MAEKKDEVVDMENEEIDQEENDQDDMEESPVEEKVPICLMKEELDAFVDSTLWKTLRRLSNISFWLIVGVLMTITILLLVAAPKCIMRPAAPWWRTQVAYSVWVPGMQDSGADQDGVGDLNGLAQRLPLLARSLAVTALWLRPTPLHTAVGTDSAILDYFGVDIRLGGTDAFRRMVAVAHEQKMRVIIDFPLSFVSTSSSYFKALARSTSDDPMRDFVLWKKYTGLEVDRTLVLIPDEELNMYLHRRSYIQKSSGNYYQYYYSYNQDRRFALINWNNEMVMKKMWKALLFWLSLGVDGFSFSQIPYVSRDRFGNPTWSQINHRLRSLFTRFNVSRTELKDSRAAISSEILFMATSESGSVSSLYDHDMRYKLDEKLFSQRACDLFTGVGVSCGSRCLHGKLQDFVALHPPKNYPIVEIGNAHTSRIVNRMLSTEKADLMLMLLMTLPSAVSIYYGDEINMRDFQSPSGSSSRSFMQWSSERNSGATKHSEPRVPVNTGYKEDNFELHAMSAFSTLRMVGRLSRLRQSSDAFLAGQLVLGPISDDFLAYRLSSNYSSTHYMVVLNFNNQSVLPMQYSGFEGFVGWPKVKEVKVVTTTPNLKALGKFVDRRSLEMVNLNLGPFQGIVLKLDCGL